ncbi:MAG TPA: RNA polymerase sigma factor, partial [Trebonia sp.]
MLVELFDAVGEELFQHCWLMVRSRGTALAVVRDTIIVAHAHIDRLRDPGQLRPWLYALTRSECRCYTPTAPEEAVQALNAAEDGARLMAWSAVMSLPPVEREMLDLTAMRGMSASDAGLVTGLGADAANLIEHARASLQQTMSAEIAARSPGIALGTVSAVKVYARLPWPDLPPGTRAYILACFADERWAGHLALAASRVPPLDSAGFPLSAERELASPREPAPPVPKAAVASTAPDGWPVASTAPNGRPVARTVPDGWPVTRTVPDGLPVAGVTAHGIDVGHRSAVSPPGLFSRTRMILGSPVRAAASRRLAAGMLAAGIAVGAALVLATAGLSLPGSTWSAAPVGSAVVAAGAADRNAAHAGSGQRNTLPVGPTGRVQAAPGFRPTLGRGPGPGTGNAAALYLATAQPQPSQRPTTGGRGVGQGGQPPGSQPGPVPSTTSALPTPPVGSPVPSGPSPSGSGSGSPPPGPSTPPPPGPSNSPG